MEEDIRKQVLSALIRDDRLAGSQVQVEVNLDEVVLRGTVPSYPALRQAQSLAWYIPGVSTIQNKLMIRYPNNYPVPVDREIEDRIRRVLQRDKDIDDAGIIIKIKKGHVIIEGDVGELWKKYWVEQIASEIPGVMQVTNKLAVIPTKHLEDMAIADAITKNLHEDSRIDLSSLDLKVKKGVITLTGVVPDKNLRNHINRTVMYTPGVVEIRDRMVIGQPG
jgi:osmotically-inducible protein OsmY